MRFWMDLMVVGGNWVRDASRMGFRMVLGWYLDGLGSIWMDLEVCLDCSLMVFFVVLGKTLDIRSLDADGFWVDSGWIWMLFLDGCLLVLDGIYIYIFICMHPYFYIPKYTCQYIYI